MSVVYNGQSTNFIGEGSPNPTQLVTPRKDQMPSAVRAGFLQVERVINNLKAAASGFYASLTGPGETVTPGHLIQEGDLRVVTDGSNGGFEVIGTSRVDLDTSAVSGPAATNGILLTSASGIIAVDNSGAGGGTSFTEDGNGGISLNDNGDGGIILNANGVNDGVYITAAAAAANGINLTSNGTGVFVGGAASDVLSFYSTVSGATQQTVTGSRGGNAALASLLTALAATGLIVDSTTP